MKAEKVVKEYWGDTDFFEKLIENEIQIKTYLEIAFKKYLYSENTPNIRRTWTKDEEDFLILHAKRLNVREASNLLYRSHHATYQRVRVLGLDESMINKK